MQLYTAFIPEGATEAVRLSIRQQLISYAYYSIMGHRLLKFAAMDRSSFGKPFLPNSAFQYSISYSTHAISVLAALKVEIGVDVMLEEMTPLCSDLDVFTLKEQSFLAQKPECVAMLFTRKEALLKAAGFGFHFEPKHIDILEQSVLFLATRYHLRSYFSEALQATISVCSQQKQELDALHHWFLTISIDNARQSIQMKAEKKLQLMEL